MAQTLISGGGRVLGGGIKYAPLLGAAQLDTVNWPTNQIYVKQVISTAGEISLLNVELSASPRASGGDDRSFIFTLVKNDVDTALTCTITNEAITGSDSSHSVPVVRGDVVYIKFAPSPTGTTTGFATYSIPQISTLFTPTTAGENLVLGHASNSSRTDNSYAYISAGYQNNTGLSATTIYQVVPTPLSYKDLCVELTTAPGVGSNWVVNVRKNGVATALTVTISGTNKTGTFTSSSVAFARGDRVDYEMIPTSNPANTGFYMGLTEVPDTAGEFCVYGGSISGGISGGTKYYNYPVPFTHNTTWSATEALRQQLGGAFTAQKLVIKLSSATGAVGKGYTITLMKNGVATSLTCSAEGVTNVDASDLTTQVPNAVGDNLSIEVQSYGLPAARSLVWSFVGVSAVAGDKTVELSSAQALTLTLKSPTVTYDCNVYPSAQSLTLLQKSVTETYDKQVTVSAQSLSLVQFDPYIQTGASIGINVSAQDLALALKNPTVVISSGGVGDENTYLTCDTAVGNVDTLKKYVDGVLVEEDTATTKTIYSNVVFSSNGFGKIISLTTTGDNKTYTMSQTATTTEYLVLLNNNLYTTDDNQFPFSVSGTTLTFVSTLPTDLASTKKYLICV